MSKQTAAIAKMDQFIDPLVDEIAGYIANQDYRESSLLDKEIVAIDSHNLRICAMVGAMVCRRRAMEKYGRTGICINE